MAIPVYAARTDIAEAGRGIAANLGFTIGTASVVILSPNPWRKKVTLVNDSDTIIFITKGDIAILNTGARLNAAGGSMTIEPDTAGYIWKGAISGISSAATKNLCVTEEW